MGGVQRFGSEEGRRGTYIFQPFCPPRAGGGAEDVDKGGDTRREAALMAATRAAERGLSARARRARPTAHLRRRPCAQRYTQCFTPRPRTAPALRGEMRRGGSHREPALSPRVSAARGSRIGSPMTSYARPKPMPNNAVSETVLKDLSQARRKEDISGEITSDVRDSEERAGPPVGGIEHGTSGTNHLRASSADRRGAFFLHHLQPSARNVYPSGRATWGRERGNRVAPPGSHGDASDGHRLRSPVAP